MNITVQPLSYRGAIEITIRDYSSNELPLTITRELAYSPSSSAVTIATINTQTADPITFIDNTIESGVAYKYFVNTTQSSIVSCCYDDIFISGGNRELRLAFNPTVSGLKYNVQDSIIPTLGGAFPKIRRNGKMKYRTFSLSGLLTLNAEINDTFDLNNIIFNDSRRRTTPDFNTTFDFSNSLFFEHEPDDSELKKSFRYCDSLLNSGAISRAEYNQTMEKLYRDAVIDYLHEHKMRLFRSPTEGVICVYLTNIALTPNAQLGRCIYDFSCQATEIMEFGNKALLSIKGSDQQ